MLSKVPSTLHSISYTELASRCDLECVSSTCPICLEELAHPVTYEASESQFAAAPNESNSKSNPILYHFAPKSRRDSKDSGQETKNPQLIHAWHDSCLRSWLVYHSVCPVCKTDLEGPHVPKRGINWSYQFKLLFQEMKEEFTEKASNLQTWGNERLNNMLRVSRLFIQSCLRINQVTPPFMKRLFAPVTFLK